MMRSWIEGGMKHMVMVSVIIPVYNAEKYVGECLDSVLGQTMQSLEVICIDDGSVDHSLNILRGYQDADMRVQVLTQENQGSGHARNRGMRVAAGKYIAFLDADDFWHDKFVLEEIVNTAERYSCDVMGTFWGHYRAGKYERANLHSEYFEQGEKGRWIAFGDEQNCFNYGSYLYKKNFLMDNQIFFPSYYRFQDPPFLTEVLIKACSYYVIPVDWYCYRTVYKRALSTSRKTTDFVKGVTDVFEMAQKYQFQKLSEEMISQINEASPYLVREIMQDNTELPVLLGKLSQYATNRNIELTPVSFVSDSIYKRCQMIADEFWNHVKNIDTLVIYGAGYCGNLLLKQLERRKTDLEIVFAETEDPEKKEVCGRKCLWIDELVSEKERVLVVIAVIRKTQPELVFNIRRLGFERYICLDETLMTALECTGESGGL